MIGADDIEGDVALEFPQSQRCVPLGVVFAELLFVAECCPGQQVQLSHLRADQTLDVTAEARLARRPPSIAIPASSQPLLNARLRKSDPLSTCTVVGRPATGHGSLISRSLNHTDLSKTECKRHRLVDNRDGASIVR